MIPQKAEIASGFIVEFGVEDTERRTAEPTNRNHRGDELQETVWKRWERRRQNSSFIMVVFGFMNCYYSLRRISAACGYDIRMLHLLQGKKVSSHERLGDFIRNQLAGNVMKKLFISLSRSCRNEVIFHLPICL